MSVRNSDWQARNLDNLSRRLQWLVEKPDGLVHVRRISQGGAAVIKDKDQIQLYFVELNSESPDPQISGIMSRVSLDNPVGLLGIYMQAMMLSLAWRPRPKAVYILGFGGGRLPIVLHHYFPEALIDSSELDAGVVDLAEEFFGVELDERMNVSVDDGRIHLESREQCFYDIILIDCFFGTGASPNHLATVEFYDLCKRRLAPDGIVTTYFIDNDPLLKRKIATFEHCFQTVRRFSHEGAHVLYGVDGPVLSDSDFLNAINTLEKEHCFRFPFRERAEKVWVSKPLNKTEQKELKLLRDGKGENGVSCRT